MEHLTKPHKHTRNESECSHNYSLLDIYGSDAGFEDAADRPDPDGMGTLLAGSDVTSPVQPSLTSPEMAVQSPLSGSHYSNASTGDSGAVSFWSSPRLPPSTSKTMADVLKSDTDLYGFNKQSTLFDSTKLSYNAWFERYLPHLVTQKRKWMTLMKQSGLPVRSDTDCPSRFPPKSARVKKFIRRGIPPEWRGSAWFFYAGGHEKLNKNVGVYQKIISETVDVKNKETEVIEKDLYRTFPDNIHFKSGLEIPETPRPEPQVISALRRVLVSFAHYQPQTGYCQSLNFIAGLLLMFMSEERAFWMLVIMTERILPKVHSADLEGVHTDQGVLMMCIKEYIPKLWSNIGRSFDGTAVSENKILTRLPPLTLVTSSWFMSVFIGSAPIESVLRIWDILWYEGSKTIFRISLTICRLSLDRFALQVKDGKVASLGDETEQIEMFQFFQKYPKSLTDPNLLVDLCFKKIGGYGYGFLSQDEINKCREFVSSQRSKLQTKKNALLNPEISEHEKEALKKTGSSWEDGTHEVYDFHKTIMSGVAWNKHISGIMRKKKHHIHLQN